MKRGTIEDKVKWLASVGIKFPPDGPEKLDGVTVSRETLQTALDALLYSVDLVAHEYVKDWRHGLPTRAVQLAVIRGNVEAHKSAIAAIEGVLK